LIFYFKEIIEYILQDFQSSSDSEDDYFIEFNNNLISLLKTIDKQIDQNNLLKPTLIKIIKNIREHNSNLLEEINILIESRKYNEKMLKYFADYYIDSSIPNTKFRITGITEKYLQKDFNYFTLLMKLDNNYKKVTQQIEEEEIEEEEDEDDEEDYDGFESKAIKMQENPSMAFETIDENIENIQGMLSTVKDKDLFEYSSSSIKKNKINNLIKNVEELFSEIIEDFEFIQDVNIVPLDERPNRADLIKCKNKIQNFLNTDLKTFNDRFLLSGLESFILKKLMWYNKLTKQEFHLTYR
jgi:hypothetical protein